jgi:hypothetical protein
LSTGAEQKIRRGFETEKWAKVVSRQAAVIRALHELSVFKTEGRAERRCTVLVRVKFGRILVALVCLALAPSASAVTAEVAKKCDALTAKAYPLVFAKILSQFKRPRRCDLNVHFAKELAVGGGSAWDCRLVDHLVIGLPTHIHPIAAPAHLVQRVCGLLVPSIDLVDDVCV